MNKYEVQNTNHDERFMEQHRHLDDELNSLRDRVLLLGGETEAALERAMYSLIERDSEVASQVLENDDQIDRLEVEIDRQCIEIIALRQPAARDLRFVISVAKMAPVLERIADHAANIARIALDLNNEPGLKSVAELSGMSEHGLKMLHQALDAFTSSDAATARQVIESDSKINDLYNHIFHQLSIFSFLETRDTCPNRTLDVRPLSSMTNENCQMTGEKSILLKIDCSHPSYLKCFMKAASAM